MLSAPLVTTKLHIPPLYASERIVSRPRLLERLNDSLRRGHRLAIVSAPAGFGKTTLIVEWVQQAARPVAWLSLDDADNDVYGFLSYVITALQRVDSKVGARIRDVLGAETQCTSISRNPAAWKAPSKTPSEPRLNSPG